MKGARPLEELLNEVGVGTATPDDARFARISYRAAISGMIAVGRISFTVKGQRGSDQITVFTVAKAIFDLDYVEPRL
jgi:hypothetical protein